MVLKGKLTAFVPISAAIEGKDFRNFFQASPFRRFPQFLLVCAVFSEARITDGITVLSAAFAPSFAHSTRSVNGEIKSESF